MSLLLLSLRSFAVKETSAPKMLLNATLPIHSTLILATMIVYFPWLEFQPRPVNSKTVPATNWGKGGEKKTLPGINPEMQETPAGHETQIKNLTFRLVAPFP